MYTLEEIKVANSTSRSGGATAIGKDGTIKAIVPIFVQKNVDKQCSVLDFGAGKAAMHTKWLKDNGFKNVTAYDFGANSIEGVHDWTALARKYDVVFASNVLNVQISMEMLMETLDNIWHVVKNGGKFICNYPSSPRKMDMSANELKGIIQIKFGADVEMVGGTRSAPLWQVVKPYVN